MPHPLSLISIKEVMIITGLSKTTIYSMVKKGEFPRPKRPTPRRVRWKITDVEKWINKLPNSEA